MAVERVIEPFCKYCKGTNISIDDTELVDGDDMYLIYKEWCTCNTCGKDFMRIMEWKLAGFTFYKDDDEFKLEDIDYEVEYD